MGIRKGSHFFTLKHAIKVKKKFNHFYYWSLHLDMISIYNVLNKDKEAKHESKTF